MSHSYSSKPTVGICFDTADQLPNYNQNITGTAYIQLLARLVGSFCGTRDEETVWIWQQ